MNGQSDESQGIGNAVFLKVGLVEMGESKSPGGGLGLGCLSQSWGIP